MSPSYNKETTSEEVASDLSTQIRGKVILTTGVSPGGLGAFFVSAIAKHSPKLLILAGRNTEKVAATAAALAEKVPGIRTRILELDLSDQTQVRCAAAEVNDYAENIDVLVNNAGIMACPYATTKEGLESQFGTMHIGHFLFTNLIMEKILAGDGKRIVSVSSDGHRLGPIRFEDVHFQVNMQL